VGDLGGMFGAPADLPVCVRKRMVFAVGDVGEFEVGIVFMKSRARSGGEYGLPDLAATWRAHLSFCYVAISMGRFATC
jgi:hypothetical protein